MLLTIYVKPDHCAFIDPADPSSPKVIVEVMQGTELVSMSGTTYLKDRQGKLHSAQEVLTFCQSGAQGYQFVTKRT